MASRTSSRCTGLEQEDCSPAENMAMKVVEQIPGCLSEMIASSVVACTANIGTKLMSNRRTRSRKAVPTDVVGSTG